MCVPVRENGSLRLNLFANETLLKRKMTITKIFPLRWKCGRKLRKGNALFSANC